MKVEKVAGLGRSQEKVRSFVNVALDFTCDHLELLLGGKPKGIQPFIEKNVKA